MYFYCDWKTSKTMIVWQLTWFITCREEAWWARPLQNNCYFDFLQLIAEPYSRCGNSCVKPSVAPEEAACNLINCNVTFKSNYATRLLPLKSKLLLRYLTGKSKALEWQKIMVKLCRHNMTFTALYFIITIWQWAVQRQTLPTQQALILQAQLVLHRDVVFDLFSPKFKIMGIFPPRYIELTRYAWALTHL